MNIDFLAFLNTIAPVVYSLLGVVVGSVMQYYISKAQDERRFKREEEKKSELDNKRKITAYRLLKSFTDRIAWRTQATGETQKTVLEEELEGMESTIAQNYDVLDETTIAAWDTKSITRTGYGSDSTPWVVLVFEAFIADVNKHYEEYRYKAIPPKS